MIGYYDVILGLIPVSLLGITGLLHGGAGLGLTVAVPLAAAVAALFIGHAMFVNAPIESVSQPLRPDPPAVSAD